MSTEISGLGSGPTSSSAYQSIGGHFQDGNQLYEGLKNLILSLGNGFLGTLNPYATITAPSTEAREDPNHLQLLSVVDRPGSETHQDHEGTTAQPPNNHSITFASQGDDLEAAWQTATSGEEIPHRINPRSKLSATWMAVLVIGSLFLIVVPGLALGFATRQVQWGITLSGVIATIAGFFAGLC